MVAGRLARYPFPVAHPAHLVDTARDPNDRLDRAQHSIEMTAVALGVLALGWARSRGQASEAAQRWQDAVDRKGIALGGWIALLQSVRPAMAGAASDPLGRAVGQAIAAALPVLNGFTPTRNQYAHGGKPRVRSELEAAAKDLNDRLGALIDAIEPLTGVQIAVVRHCVPVRRGGHGVDLDVFTGYAEAPAAHRLPSRRSFEPGSVIAFCGGTLEYAVDLTPFCIHHECTNCRRDELFYLTRRRNSRSDYYTFATGHQLRRPRDRDVETVASLSSLGMEPLGAVRTEAMRGWRANWADLAPRGQRLAARTVDVLVLGVIAAVIGLPALAAGLAPLWAVLMAGVGVLAYEPVAALRGGTLGKRLLGIGAISVWDSRPLGRADSLRRALFVDAELLLPPLAVRSLAWLLWDPARQPWHDRLAKSFVIADRAAGNHKR